MAVKQSQSRTHLQKKAFTLCQAEQRSEGLKSRPFSLQDNASSKPIEQGTSTLQAKPQRLGHTIANTLALSSVAQPQAISTLQRKTNRLMQHQKSETASSTIESQLDQAKSGGQSLPLTIRRSMEGAFKQDFSGVKIHTDERADVLNRSMQAQAFTNNNHIFFKKDKFKPDTTQGQELIAHELTHVVQQNSNLIQCKGNNVAELKAETINTSVFGSSESQKMNKLVAQYNAISTADFKYGLHINLLKEIRTTASNWITQYDKKNDTKVATKLANESDLTSYLEPLEVNEKNRAKDIGLLIIHVNTEVGAVETQIQSNTQISAPAIKDGHGISKGKEFAGEAYDQVGEVGVGAKDTFDGIKAVVQSSKEGAQAVLDGMQEQGDSVLETVMKVLGGGLQGLSDILSGTAKHIVEMVTGVITSIAKLVTAYKEKKALKESHDTTSNQELKDATLHALNKVRRRFGMACLEFGKSLMVTIGRIVGLFGFPLATVVTETIAKVIDFGSLAVRKVKGIYKQVKGTRGVAREKDATVIIRQAIQGDDNALTLLVRLNPMSFGLKEFLASLNPIAVGFKKYIYKHNISENDLPGSDVNATNKIKMCNLLNKLNATGNSDGFSMKKFIDLTAEKFKSFA